MSNKQSYINIETVRLFNHKTNTSAFQYQPTEKLSTTECKHVV